MIGDNPHADIKGGNDNGCVSILVSTGVWKPEQDTPLGQQNDPHNPAQVVVRNMNEAFREILRREGL